MSMTQAYRNGIAAHGGSLVRFIGLVGPDGQELAGGEPAYARRSVSWTTPEDGRIRPTADLLFDVPAGATVAGWCGHSSLKGGTDYGGADLTPETYTDQGQFELIASKTAITHPQG